MRRNLISMSIKLRFLISTAIIILITCLLSWHSMRSMAEDIISNWIERYAEKQIRYEKVRTLSPLLEEVSLSREFSLLDSLRQWVEHPDDEVLKVKAFEEAERFRLRFSDQSYFIALAKSGRYYYGESNLQASDDRYRYTLYPDKESDAWFYALIQSDRDLHLNVNPDVELGVVKLWSDVIIRDQNGEALAIVGTGLDLSTFLNQMMHKQDIYSAIIFTDYQGSIQLHQKEELIDFASVTKQSHDKQRIFELLDNDDSVARLKESFISAKEKPNQVEMTAIQMNGSRQLASVIYIPEIDWFQVSVIDIKTLIALSQVSSILVIFFVFLIFALFAFYILLTLIVTKPIAELDTSIRSLKEKNYQPPKLSRFAGSEIKRLFSHYQNMSTTLLSYQHELEEKVSERTQELSRLSKIDPLTELYNRRGFEVFVKEYMHHWQTQERIFGLINVDVDRFKQINDQYGHLAGDLVLQKIASYLLDIIGDDGEVARWGGDEFLILVKQANSSKIAFFIEQLLGLTERLTTHVKGEDIAVGLSVGSALVQHDDTFEKMLGRADKAMYEMKQKYR